jgi:peptide/nickel transport system permease protein
VGATHRRILWREILPNVVPPMLSFGLLAVAIVIVGEGALAFLGLSVSAPTPSWGALIERGRDSLGDAAHISLGPAFMMFLTLVALNHVGDRLSRRFDIREAAM